MTVERRKNVTFGEKIRARRLALGKTQAEIAGDGITRNMLSRLESDKATPSLETVRYLADALDIPVAYLFTESDDLFLFIKEKEMPRIRRLFTEFSFSECEKHIRSLPVQDDETAFLGATATLYAGREHLRLGNLVSALADFDRAEEYMKKTVYPTKHLRALLCLYRPVARNIKAPLLEMDDKEYLTYLHGDAEEEYYHYLRQDADYPYTQPLLKLHTEARQYLRAKKYDSALPLLQQIEERKNEDYDAHRILGVYTDLELCYRELCNFELAYRYASKRLSLMESFRS